MLVKRSKYIVKNNIVNDFMTLTLKSLTIMLYKGLRYTSLITKLYMMVLTEISKTPNQLHMLSHANK